MYVMFSNAGKGDEPSREDFKYVAFATISVCFEFWILNNWETVKHVILNLELEVNKVNRYKKNSTFYIIIGWAIIIYWWLM